MKAGRFAPLAVLSMIVLAAHLAALSSAPAWFAPAAASTNARPSVFTARQLEFPLPSAPLAATAPAAAPDSGKTVREVGNRLAAPAQLTKPQDGDRGESNASELQQEAGDAPQPAGEISGVRSGLVASAAPQPPQPPRQGDPAGASGLAAAVAMMPSQRMHYRVELHKSVFAMTGKGELAWRQDGSTYEASLEVDVPLVYHRVQKSTGQVSAAGLEPRRFSDRARSEEAAHFVPAEGKVIFSTNQPQARWVAGMQDRLSVLLQLGAMIAGSPTKFPRGTAISIETAGTRDAEPWLFTVDEVEKLDLPGGHVQGLKLTRQPRKQYDVRVELWLAPGMAYAPVRLRLTQPNGDWVDQQWSGTDRG